MKTLNKYIDHTNLKPDSKQEVIRKLCSDAREWDFASVCVNPCNIPLAKQLLEGTTVKVCTVIGFPLGQNTTKVKVAETEDAYAMGCDEFDMVINVGRLKDGEEDYVRNEIAAVVAAAKGKTVKVIIETGLLTDQEKATATRLSCEAGAHFVKTCTGVSQ
ncbi:MAG: deoxyribose-phosphate aldolase, partial [Clostridia bacterium]|nr:deoxyribose-phosphate aldolase [Clostridia bacterium]